MWLCPPPRWWGVLAGVLAGNFLAGAGDSGGTWFVLFVTAVVAVASAGRGAMAVQSFLPTIGRSHQTLPK